MNVNGSLLHPFRKRHVRPKQKEIVDESSLCGMYLGIFDKFQKYHKNHIIQPKIGLERKFADSSFKKGSNYINICRLQSFHLGNVGGVGFVGFIGGRLN